MGNFVDYTQLTPGQSYRILARHRNLSILKFLRHEEHSSVFQYVSGYNGWAHRSDGTIGFRNFTSNDSLFELYGNLKFGR